MIKFYCDICNERINLIYASEDGHLFCEICYLMDDQIDKEEE